MIDESSFQIEARADQAADWIAALRRTPASSVLAVGESQLPIAVLARRASFLSTNVPGRSANGYAMPFETVLLDVKGYSPGEYQRRRRILEACFSTSPAQDFDRVTAALLELKRPIAIAFPRAEFPYLGWLRSRGVGREFYRGDRSVIWLIDGEDWRRGKSG